MLNRSDSSFASPAGRSDSMARVILCSSSDNYSRKECRLLSDLAKVLPDDCTVAAGTNETLGRPHLTLLIERKSNLTESPFYKERSQSDSASPNKKSTRLVRTR